MQRPFLFSLVLFTGISLFGQKASFTEIKDQSNLEILTPSLAERKTVKIRLENGLEAYIISDPGLDKSAAALCVEAGSWDDPQEYPGMAHFLEHMLFMGTKAYPKEEEYLQYITDHGGIRNAYTASDRTVYMFTINNAGFEGAFDRFAHFFIDPLFLPSCIERELHAVDQEYAKNIEHDGWRLCMIFKELANPSHPCTKFSLGNAQTLGGIPQAAMKTWYQNHYLPNKMHLVVYSNAPIDQLVTLTATTFNQVSSLSTQVTHSHRLDKNLLMMSDQQRGHKIYQQPIKDQKQLLIQWEIPRSLTSDRSIQSGRLIAHVLRDGGEESLLSLLKRKGLALNIDSFEEEAALNYNLFSLEVELTDLGVGNIDQVIEHCLEAIGQIRVHGIPSHIFDEVKTMSTLQYAYQSRPDPFDFVANTAHAMLNEPLSTFPSKTQVPSQYNPKNIGQYLDRLHPQAAVYFVMADQNITRVVPQKKERWFGGEYTPVKIETTMLEKWAQSSNPELGIPSANQYLPKKFDLIAPSDATKPFLIKSSGSAKAFYNPDQSYLVPKASHIFRIKSPQLDGSVRAKAFADLYTLALADHTLALGSQAARAGASIDIRADSGSFSFSFNGFSNNSNKVITTFCEQMLTLAPSAASFEEYQSKMLALYRNQEKELPVSQAFASLKTILSQMTYTPREKKAALENITYEQFCTFCAKCFEKIHLEAMLCGNLTEQKAKKLFGTVQSQFDSTAYLPENHLVEKVLSLDPNSGPYVIEQTTPMQGNGLILSISTGNYSFKKRASGQILEWVLNEAFFSTLRTKQQIAYIIEAWSAEEQGQLFCYFAIQSSSHSPDELLIRVELFLEDFIQEFTSHFPKERFEQVKKMQIASIKAQMKPDNLELAANLSFQLAFNYEENFNLLKEKLTAAQAITYEQLRADAITFLSKENRRRIAVLVKGASQMPNLNSYQSVTKEHIKDSGVYLARDECLEAR